MTTYKGWRLVEQQPTTDGQKESVRDSSTGVKVVIIETRTSFEQIHGSVIEYSFTRLYQTFTRWGNDWQLTESEINAWLLEQKIDQL